MIFSFMMIPHGLTVPLCLHLQCDVLKLLQEKNPPMELVPDLGSPRFIIGLGIAFLDKLIFFLFLAKMAPWVVATIYARIRMLMNQNTTFTLSMENYNDH